VCLAFSGEKPEITDERIKKRVESVRTDFTAGIVPGMPTTEQQEQSFKEIRDSLRKEESSFYERLKRRTRADKLEDQLKMKDKLELNHQFSAS